MQRCAWLLFGTYMSLSTSMSVSESVSMLLSLSIVCIHFCIWICVLVNVLWIVTWVFYCHQKYPQKCSTDPGGQPGQKRNEASPQDSLSTEGLAALCPIMTSHYLLYKRSIELHHLLHHLLNRWDNSLLVTLGNLQEVSIPRLLSFQKDITSTFRTLALFSVSRLDYSANHNGLCSYQ